VTIPCGRIDKSETVFLFIHWLQKEAFVTRHRRVFDQDSCRAIESPHFEPCAEDSTIGVKLVQTRHGMEAIDGDSILSVKTVIGAIFNGSSIEQTQALHSQIKALFADLVGSPHTHGIFGVHSQLDRFIELKVSPDGQRTNIPLWKNATTHAIKNAKMGIGREIVRQPAYGKGFKFSILVSSLLKARSQLGLFVIGEYANNRHERVRKCRVIPFVFVSKRNDEIAIVRIPAIPQASQDLGLDVVRDLLIERHIIVGKIGILLQQLGPRRVN
jgi:hypothetical protein